MNVYVLEVARRLAAAGVAVEIFTRATSSELAPRVEVLPGVTVWHVLAGPYEGLAKEDLANQLCAFTVGVLRAEARQRAGHYDLVHSHYWLSGQVGWIAKERWRVPLVHSMHTMAKVKNLSLAAGDRPEPLAREIGESQVVAAADRLVGNTVDETDQLERLYGADPASTSVVHPGVDVDVFYPGPQQLARRRLGLADDAVVLLFAGRIQPLKGPDVVVRAAAALLAMRPQLRSRLVVPVVGGQSGARTDQLDSLAELARSLHVADAVRFVSAMPPHQLADWYRAATATLVPSYSESFGLVALESQACGTPVVAAGVGGLTTAVADGMSGVLVDGHDPKRYAAAVAELVDRPEVRAAQATAAVRHAAQFSWDATVASLLDTYRAAVGAYTADVPRLTA